MEDDTKYYIFKDCLISEALRNNAQSPGLPSNGLYYDVVSSTSPFSSSDLNIDFPLPLGQSACGLTLDTSSLNAKLSSRPDHLKFCDPLVKNSTISVSSDVLASELYDLNDYQPIFDSSPDDRLIEGQRQLNGSTRDVKVSVEKSQGPKAECRSTTALGNDRLTIDNDSNNVSIDGFFSAPITQGDAINTNYVHHSLVNKNQTGTVQSTNKHFHNRPASLNSSLGTIANKSEGDDELRDPFFAAEYVLDGEASSTSGHGSAHFSPYSRRNRQANDVNGLNLHMDEQSSRAEEMMSSSSASSSSNHDSSSPPLTPGPPPLSYVCTVRTGRHNNNVSSNVELDTLNNFVYSVNDGADGNYESSSRVFFSSAAMLNRHRSKMQDLALRHRLITNQNIRGCGQLMLSGEERRTLIQEGYSIPTTLPLTKKEEEALKLVRRKIKNKLSAQESRRRRKEYIDTLERKLRNCQSDNDVLRQRLENLEKTNADMANQLRGFRGGGGQSNLATTFNSGSVRNNASSNRAAPSAAGVTLTALFLLFAVLIPSIPVWSGLHFLSRLVDNQYDNRSNAPPFSAPDFQPKLDEGCIFRTFNGGSKEVSNFDHLSMCDRSLLESSTPLPQFAIGQHLSDELGDVKSSHVISSSHRGRLLEAEYSVDHGHYQSFSENDQPAQFLFTVFTVNSNNNNNHINLCPAVPIAEVKRRPSNEQSDQWDHQNDDVDSSKILSPAGNTSLRPDVGQERREESHVTNESILVGF